MRREKECEATVRDMMHHKMNRALSSVGVGILCGIATACAGGDTPARNGELVQAVAREYGDGQTGAAASGGSGGGTSGSNSGGSSSGNGGSASGDGGSSSGDGGSASGDGGDGGSDTGNGGDGGGEPVDCDGFMILQTSCGTPGACHGMGAGFTDFAASEAAAAQWANEQPGSRCGDPATIFDTDNPSDSLVITKLGANPPCGSQMPLGNPGGLSPADIACIEEFISGL